jgi:hypothetical protein
MRLKRVFEGLTLVGFGLVFLGIAIGLDLMGKGLGQNWLRALSSLLVLGGLVFGVVTGPSAGFPWSAGLWGPDSVEFDFSEPADDYVREGRARVTGAVGDLTVESGDELATASGSSPFGAPVFDVDTKDRDADVEISMGESGAVWGFRGEPRMDVTLSDEVVWDLTIESGVSRLNADLTGLPLSALVLKSGVSDAEVRLGSVTEELREVTVDLEVGVSATTLRIPGDAEVRIETETGLANVDLPSGVRAVRGEDHAYESDGFARALRRYVIRVEGGIADVRIVRY